MNQNSDSDSFHVLLWLSTSMQLNIISLGHSLVTNSSQMFDIPLLFLNALVLCWIWRLGFVLFLNFILVFLQYVLQCLYFINLFWNLFLYVVRRRERTTFPKQITGCTNFFFFLHQLLNNLPFLPVYSISIFYGIFTSPWVCF